MEIRAYNEEYMPLARKVLGDAVDFAVVTLGIDPDKFMEMFWISGIAERFENGNPAYVAGINGCELVRKVLLCIGEADPEQPDELYLDKSPEYWAGWSLAFYQWFSGRSFRRITKAVPLSGIISMYSVYHEMDPMKFRDEMDQRLRSYYQAPVLKEKRSQAGLSQSALARLSGVPLRQIQLFEQGQRDIRKTQAQTLFRLSKTLNCDMEMLMD
jgi:DNA-binding transcriptional regulator YiaG